MKLIKAQVTNFRSVEDTLSVSGFASLAATVPVGGNILVIVNCR